MSRTKPLCWQKHDPKYNVMLPYPQRMLIGVRGIFNTTSIEIMVNPHVVWFSMFFYTVQTFCCMFVPEYPIFSRSSSIPPRRDGSIHAIRRSQTKKSKCCVFFVFCTLFTQSILALFFLSFFCEIRAQGSRAQGPSPSPMAPRAQGQSWPGAARGRRRRRRQWRKNFLAASSPPSHHAQG